MLRHTRPSRRLLDTPRTCNFRCSYSTPSAPSLIEVQSLPTPHTGRITLLTLSSPANKNAISRQLLAELSTEIHKIRTQWRCNDDGITARLVPGMTQNKHATSQAEDSSGPLSFPATISTSTRALIIASATPNVFCAGADLKERRTMTTSETRAFLTSLRQTLSDLATLPIPTIAAVSGFALGGGLELALSATFRVFGTTATVGLPETRLGIIPGAGGTVRLRELIGRTKAAEMILTGRRVNAREAYRLGICERLVVGDAEEDGRGEVVKEGKEEREKIIQAAVKMAEEICEGGPVAIAAALRAVGGGGVEWQKGWMEDQMYEKVVGTRDRDEALLAFQQKRKPSFTGD